MILFIDTSKSEEIEIVVTKGKKKISLKEKALNQKAQNTLLLIEKVFKKYKLNLRNLKEIKVKTGPGSYTGLRIGIAIANTISFVLGIPINGKKIGEIELPKY